MTHYVVFDETTGKSIRWGDCPDADLEHQARHPGEVVRALPAAVDPSDPPTL